MTMLCLEKSGGTKTVGERYNGIHQTTMGFFFVNNRILFEIIVRGFVVFEGFFVRGVPPAVVFGVLFEANFRLKIISKSFHNHPQIM